MDGVKERLEALVNKYEKTFLRPDVYFISDGAKRCFTMVVEDLKEVLGEDDSGG